MSSGSNPNKQGCDETSAAPTMEFSTETASAMIGSSDKNQDFSYSSLGNASFGPPLSNGTKVGKYIIRSVLGAGGMGSVYLAFDPLIEREIALKILSTEQSGSDLAVQRFIQEARAIGKLTHAHVVAIYDIDRWDNQYFIVMELITGGSLGQRVRRDGPLEWREACRLIMQAAEGLSAAHQANLIHRDVKPENLMLTADGVCKVVDFGLCKATAVEDDAESSITRANNILGTPQYMSPEQFAGGDVDARSDIYSLGGTLFYLLTGKYPFHEAKGLLQMMTAHVKQPVETASRWDPLIPSECDRIISKAMAKNREDRFPTAASMASSLRSLLARDPSSDSADDDLQSIISMPLRDVLVVEPSRMQAAVLSAALKKTGITSVRIASSLREGMQCLDASKPQAVITSLEYNDGTGLDFIRLIRQDTSMSLLSLVMNSSDPSIEEWIEASQKGHSVLSPKKTRPEDILRMIHGTGYFSCDFLVAPLSAAPVQPRLVVLTETGELSERLSIIIRELQILDVVVDSVATAAMLNSHPGPELRLIMRQGTGSPQLFAKLAVQFASSTSLTAVVQDGVGQMRLRSAWFRGMTALANAPLDSVRLRQLFQSCV